MLNCSNIAEFVYNREFLSFVSFLEMIIIIYFFAAVAAFPQDYLYLKLKNYQALTGISNEEFDFLWNKPHDPGQCILWPD